MSEGTRGRTDVFVITSTIISGFCFGSIAVTTPHISVWDSSCNVIALVSVQTDNVLRIDDKNGEKNPTDAL